MNYHSRWENLPLDVLYKQILSLKDPSEILTFCYDPYINSRICLDKNGLIWKLLFQRDLSEFPILTVEENLMDKYVETMQKSKTYDMGTLLHFAARNGYEKLIKEISLSNISSNELSLALSGDAAYCGHLDIVKYLAEKGADFRNFNEYALRNASFMGHLPVIKYLIENGADIHVYDEYPLRWSIENRHSEVTQYLLKNGANIQVAINMAKQFFGGERVVRVLTDLLQKQIT